MARVSGPLMSIDASGSVAGTITYSRWRGRPYVRRHTIPMNPMSAMQTSVRAMFAFLIAAWKARLSTWDANWLELADADNITMQNAFVKANCNRWHNFLTPGENPDFPAASTAPAAPTLVATGGKGMVTIVITAGADLPDFGWMLFHDLSACTGTIDEVEKVAVFAADPTTIIVTGLAAGTHHFKAKGFMRDGKDGIVSVADTTAVVT